MKVNLFKQIPDLAVREPGLFFFSMSAALIQHGSWLGLKDKLIGKRS